MKTKSGRRRSGDGRSKINTCGYPPFNCLHFVSTMQFQLLVTTHVSVQSPFGIWVEIWACLLLRVPCFELASKRHLMDNHIFPRSCKESRATPFLLGFPLKPPKTQSGRTDPLNRARLIRQHRQSCDLEEGKTMDFDGPKPPGT